MSKLKFFLLKILIHQAIGFSWWNDLRITWNPDSTKGYNKLPLTREDATKSGWINISGDDCENGGAFNGFRYIPSQNAPGIALLLDQNGNVGGFQSLLPHSEVILEDDVTDWTNIPMFQNHTINGILYSGITVYFVQPELICKTDASSSTNIGENSELYFQDGFGPSKLKIGYKTRKEATENGWTEHKCVPGMGWHNFYRVDTWKDDCSRMQPTCLLYNKENELFGFCLKYPGKASSKYYEHPPPAALNAVLTPAPKCFSDQLYRFGCTTIHVYFISDPWKVEC